MKQVKETISYDCREIVEEKHLGRGVRVAVMDTGICEHPDLTGQIFLFGDFINRRKVLYDDNGHGTHVAGILAGDGRLSGGRFAGIAPEAELLILKVLDSEGNGSIRNLIMGIQWLLENYKKYDIRIVNISVGSRKDINKSGADILVKAVERLWDAGLVVVASAGNYGPEKGSIAVPGVSKKIITVGSVEEIWSADYSGRGPTEECVVKPDVLAPGTHIISCSGRFDRSGKRPYIAKSGTSMATPIVSGAVACLLSKYPDMSNVEVKMRLRETIGKEKLLNVAKFMSA